jgi:1-acyl-sn-glycerol-3-phosphate acyltransferase
MQQAAAAAPAPARSRLAGALHFAFFAVTGILATLICFVLVVAALPFDRITRGHAGRLVLKYYWGPVLLALTGQRHEARGFEKVPRDRPVVVLSNHQSMLDVPALLAALPVPVRMIGKKEVFWTPLVGWYGYLAGYIRIDRSNSAAAVRSLRRAAETVRRGATILAFPEGTRSREGVILPFKKGLFRLALDAGVPIVPVAIEGSHRAWPKHEWRIYSGAIRMAAGDPISTEGMAAEEAEALLVRVRNAIIDLHLELGGRGGSREDAVAAAGVEGLGRSARRQRS